MDLAVSPDEKGPAAGVDLATGERVNLELLHGLLERVNGRVLNTNHLQERMVKRKRANIVVSERCVIQTSPKPSTRIP